MANVAVREFFYEAVEPAERRALIDIPYTLKEEDLVVGDKVYKSLKKIYLEMEDVTEFEFAMATIGSYKLWERLTKSQALREHIDQWRKELSLKLKAKALKEIVRAAAGNSFPAMKYLADKSYIENTTNKRGRPSKEDIQAELKKEMEASRTFQNDAKRIGLNLQ